MSTVLSSLDPQTLSPAIRAALELLETALATERTARAELQAKADTLAAQNRRLEHLLREFKRALHGRKSEKVDPDQLELAFEDLETAVAEAETAKAASAAATAVSPTPRAPAQRNLGRLPKELPRIERVIEPESIHCPCGCGAMTRIGEDRSERLDIVPATFRVIVTVRPKYACRACEGRVVQAPAQLIEGGLPTEGTIAQVLVGKYADHCPLYRQAQIYGRSGLELHRSTLAGWIGKASFHLAPVIERMAEHLRSSQKLFMDETTAPVLDPGRGKTKTGYLWALARDDRGWAGSDPPAVVYFYAPGRSGEHGEKFLEGFQGILQVDGYAGYNRLTRPDRPGGPVVLAHCWSHARRKLHEVFEADRSPIAAEGLKQIAALYRIEAEIAGQSREQRLAARQARAAPLVEAFGRWLAQQRGRISAKSRLGEKLAYIANHWTGLQVFLGDGRVEISSNAVENRVRPIALNRKNALFAGHDEGGTSWARISSLIETAKLNHVNPFDYLKATLEAIANGHPMARLDELLPWSFRPASS